MTRFDGIQFALYVFLLILCTKPMGAFMAQVFEGQKHILSKPLGWLERLTYKVSGVDPDEEMSWKDYATALMVFTVLGILFIFLIQVTQKMLPWNTQDLPNVSWHSALNTAVSFVTNTNWQGYSPETTMSYFTQMIALAVHNFMSAAVGMAVAVALARGIARRSTNTIGNFWADSVRATIYVLLPLSVVFTIFLVGQGVVQNLRPYVEAMSLEGVKQIIPMGPAASQVAI